MATEQYSIGYEEGFQNGWNAAVDAKPEQPAQQEPVAYWIPKAEQFCIASPSGRPFAKAWEPLYASPPAQRTWVGLTQEERDHIWYTVGNSDAHGDVDGWSGRDVMSAIEAKLRSKNEDRN